MLTTISSEIARQRIAELHRQASRDRLGRELTRARRAHARLALRRALHLAPADAWTDGAAAPGSSRPARAGRRA
jgi:hypothetical protein